MWQPSFNICCNLVLISACVLVVDVVVAVTKIEYDMIMAMTIYVYI